MSDEKQEEIKIEGPSFLSELCDEALKDHIRKTDARWTEDKLRPIRWYHPHLWRARLLCLRLKNRMACFFSKHQWSWDMETLAGDPVQRCVRCGKGWMYIFENGKEIKKDAEN